jgi:Arc/MetJ-type ribon-helix-helix transcriptional regulator
MAIELSPDTERQVQELVQSGRFASADECVQAVLARFRQLEKDQEERLAELRAHGDEVRRLVAEGAAALERGDFVEYDDESLKAFFEQIKREGREWRKLQAAS